jgi:hypothetical protein
VNHHFVLLQEMCGEYIMWHPPFLHFQCPIDLPGPIIRVMVCTFIATQDRVFPHYVPNSSIKHSKSDSKDRSQEIL